ncbi:acyl-CoA dehydrogenase family protein [Streptomyces sp. NPDC004111]|uniref:acyl-CoA dehydrogenase family protein n=1 Tax=Streptomyces sp. NPDC004111 TaxID=3364690 RepID=UPI0036C1A97C
MTIAPEAPLADARPHPAAFLGAAEIGRRLGALAPLVRARQEEIDRGRRLPHDLVEELRATGVFRSAMPREWGGPELTSMEQIELIEQLARTDASVAWCAMIGMDSGIYAGYLRPDAARTLFPRLDTITAGWLPPAGRADEVPGGYRVRGHWRFGSGCTHADVVAGGCTVHRDGKPLLDAAGRPVWRVVLAPADRFTVHDTWHTTGLAGTGSCDYTAEDLLVPAEHTFSFDEPYRDGPLHRRSDAILRKMSGVPLGVARGALDHVYGLADLRGAGPGTPWRESEHVQGVVAECEMRLAAARSEVFASVEAQWRRLEAGEPATHRERAAAALARYHAFRTAREITAQLYDLVGGDAIHRTRSPLDRALRDMTTACQHVVGQRKILQWSGQLLMGQEPETAFL